MTQQPASSRAWVSQAIERIEADRNRSADTHLLRVEAPGLGPAAGRVALYLKDESSHPTGSLKHRLARSLFLYALCNGWLREGMTIVEASSGSTAVSEAYFARMLGLPFVAVMPRNTAAEKIAAIEFHGGRCHFVERGSEVYAAAAGLAEQLGGHYMDQFTYAERATDWRGNNNIAESIFEQMAREPHPIPRWVVCGAGTGGTSATIGRFVRYHQHATEICVADPECSAFHRHWRDSAVCAYDGAPSLIEGIGRPRVEASFMPHVIDEMIAVPDAASIAAARVLSRRLSRPCGGSTGTNIWACAILATRMAEAGEEGSIVSILCDHGERYKSTYFNDDWLAMKCCDLSAYEARVDAFFETGRLAP